MELGVIIAAGGVGSRMGAGGSKQLLGLAGRPVLSYSIGIFDPLEIVLEIVVAIEAGDMDRCHDEVIAAGGFRKVKQLVAGGASRAESVRNALASLGREADTVLVHDGARPLFPAELLDRGLMVLDDESVDGIVFGMPVTDTIKETGEDGLVARTLDRGRLWAAQTPQVFRRPVLERGYARPLEELAASTDDSSLVEAVGGRVLMVEGSPENIKLTTPVDIGVAEAIIAGRAEGA